MQLEIEKEKGEDSGWGGLDNSLAGGRKKRGTVTSRKCGRRRMKSEKEEEEESGEGRVRGTSNAAQGSLLRGEMGSEKKRGAKTREHVGGGAKPHCRKKAKEGKGVNVTFSLEERVETGSDNFHELREGGEVQMFKRNRSNTSKKER